MDWAGQDGQKPHEHPPAEPARALLLSAHALGACLAAPCCPVLHCCRLAEHSTKPTGEAGCSCCHGGHCRAIAVGASPLFLFFPDCSVTVGSVSLCFPAARCPGQG